MMPENNFTTVHLLEGGKSSCPLFPLETWKCDTIMIFHRVTACVSVIGCAVVLFTMWLFRRYKVFHQRMILFISVCGGGGAIANIMGESPANGLCKIIAFINTFFDWAMLLWVVAVAIRLCLTIFRRSKAGRYEWVYHYVIWPVSLTVGLLPFFSDKYGNSGVWCWIIHDVGWRMGMWYGPMFFVTIVLFCLYISIIVKTRSMLNTWHRTNIDENKTFLRAEVLPLVFYPFVYILLYVIPTINRIHNAIYPNEPEFVLVVLAAISATSLGAANSLIYGLDKETRRKLTRDQIKNAWLSHFVPRVKMGKYSIETKSGDSQTEAKKQYSVSVSSGASQTEVKQPLSLETQAEPAKRGHKPTTSPVTSAERVPAVATSATLAEKSGHDAPLDRNSAVMSEERIRSGGAPVVAETDESKATANQNREVILNVSKLDSQKSEPNGDATHHSVHVSQTHPETGSLKKPKHTATSVV